jgi:hypothetical protein
MHACRWPLGGGGGWAELTASFAGGWGALAATALLLLAGLEPRARHPCARRALCAAAYAANPLALAVAACRPADAASNLLLAALAAACGRGLGLAAAVLLAHLAASGSALQAACAAPPALLCLWQAAAAPAAAPAPRWLPPARAAARQLCAAAAAAALCRALQRGGLLLPRGSALQPLHVDFAAPWWPELSPWWYLTASAFLPQLRYHTLLAWAHPALYVAPLCLALRARPQLALTAVVCLAALLDASAGWTLARLPLAAALLLSAPDVAREMRGRACAPWLALLALPLMCAPSMKRAWLAPPGAASGGGNANLLLNQQLLFTLAGGSLLSEWVAAALRLLRADRRGRRRRAAAAAGETSTGTAAPPLACGSCS